MGHSGRTAGIRVLGPGVRRGDGVRRADGLNRLSVHIHGWLLLLPAAVLLVAFTHYPAAATLFDSFFSTPKPGRSAVFVGLDNYRAMFDDPVFWQALANNVWFALGTIPVSIALALLMAVLVNQKLAGRGFLRLAYFTPTILPMIAVANIWLFFYTPQYGLLEQLTGSCSGCRSHNWLGSRDTALACVIVVTIWKEAGFFMIFYLAALQQVPPSLAEAAGDRGREPLVLLPPRDLAAAGADDAVRAGQRGDQRVPARRPHHRDDPRRARTTPPRSCSSTSTRSGSSSGTSPTPPR